MTREHPRLFPLVAGDTGPALVAVVTLAPGDLPGEDPLAAPGAVVFELLTGDDAAAPAAGPWAGTVESEAAPGGRVRVTLRHAWPVSPDAGSYFGRFTWTLPSGRRVSIPPDRSLRVRVHE